MELFWGYFWGMICVYFLVGDFVRSESFKAKFIFLFFYFGELRGIFLGRLVVISWVDIFLELF